MHADHTVDDRVAGALDLARAAADHVYRADWWFWTHDPIVDRDDYRQAAYIALWRLAQRTDPATIDPPMMIRTLRLDVIDWRRTIAGRTDYARTHRRAVRWASLDQPADSRPESDGTATLGDLVGHADDGMVDEVVAGTLARDHWSVVRRLPPIQRLAFLAGTDRSGGVTLNDVAQVLGVTESRVCQIRAKATQWVRERIRT